MNNINEKESVKVLRECIELQLKKSQDYQNPNSNVVQAMHYRRGVDTIHDIMHGKMLRAQSLIEANGITNFESLEDTYKDLINYASFAVSYLRGKMEGQDPNRDMYNRKIMKFTQDPFTVNEHANGQLSTGGATIKGMGFYVENGGTIRG